MSYTAVLLPNIIFVNDARQVVGTSKILRDISDRKASEQKLLRINEQLEISNRKLSDFAYVVSHDLQEPLRKIQAFADRLKSTCQDSFRAYVIPFHKKSDTYNF